MPEEQDQLKIGEILVERGVISSKHLEEALQEQRDTGRFIGEVLISRGAADEEQIVRSLSEQLGFAYVDLSDMTIEPKAAELVPQKICVKHTVIPIFIMQDTLTIAMSNPLDIKAIDEVQAVSKCRVKPVFACPTAIRLSIEKQYQKESREQKAPAAGAQGASEIQPEAGEHIAHEINTLKRAANLAPVIDIVNSIITRAVKMGASDIHLEPERKSFECRYRIDGVLYPATRISADEQASVISRIKIMANMDIAEKRLPQDGRIRTTVAGNEVDLRVSTFPTIYGENLVIRILDRSQGVLKLDQLGFSESSLESYRQLIIRPYGIILVTGPTGSGKTTTLYAALNEINSLEKNIITLEDPVEYEISHVRQSQVNVKAGLTFAAGLRSIVRQDPDVIMIGEIRDKETAEIAIHASLTGHLVFSTLHTNDAVAAVTRLIDMGVEPFLVSSSVIGIIAQRLIRILCNNCKQKYAPSPDMLKQFNLNAKQGYTFYKEISCDKCKHRGYTGRSGIYEFFIPTDRAKELIGRKASANELREEAIASDMKTLREAGLEKVMEGLTSVSEILRVTEEA